MGAPLGNDTQDTSSRWLVFDVPCLINMAPRTPDRPVAELEAKYRID